MLVIKAGGSVITRRGLRPSFDRAAAARLSRALAGLREPFVLVHGTGSFGKPPAGRYGYLSGRIRPGSAPVAAIRALLLRLHSLLVSELTANGVKAVSCPGSACFSLSAGRPRLRQRQQLLEWLGRGYVPVVNSDIFPCPGGFAVVSSDALMAALAARLRPELAVFFTRAAGVLGPRGELVRCLRAGQVPALLRGLRPAPGDVSGGIRAKMAEIARIARGGTDSAVLDGRRPELLLELRRGGSPQGTYIHAT